MIYDELLTRITQRGVHPLLGDTGQGYHIEQNAHELATFLEAMLELGVSKILEIGTGHRMGLARFLANDLGWRVVTLDKDQPANHYPNVEYLMGTSAILRPLFNGSQFDLVILDGDNTYEGVVQDYVMYAPLATKAVAVCKIGGARGCEGVARFWSELEKTVRGEHVLAESEQASGIGWYQIRDEEIARIGVNNQVAKINGSTVEIVDLDELVHEPVIIEEDVAGVGKADEGSEAAPQAIPPEPVKVKPKAKPTTKRKKKTA